MEQDVKIRHATKDDAEFIVHTIARSMNLNYEPSQHEFFKKLHDSLIECVCMERSLYSYTNTLIAELYGRVVGAIISYPGHVYHGFRVHTFSKIYEDTGLDLTANPMETTVEEYYIDCIMVLPEYRNQGIGRKLIQARIKTARNYGLKKVTLLAKESDNELHKFYFGLNFMHEPNTLHIFGDDYYRFVRFLTLYD